MVRIVSSHRSIAVLGRVGDERNGKIRSLFVSFFFSLSRFSGFVLARWT